MVGGGVSTLRFGSFRNPFLALSPSQNVVIGNTRAIQNSFSPAHYLARVLPINAKGFTGSIARKDPRRRVAHQRRFEAFPCADFAVTTSRAIQRGGPADAPSIAARTNGIGGAPNPRNWSWNWSQAFLPPRDAVQSSRSFRIISLPSV
jgi:hypothetical protein